MMTRIPWCKRLRGKPVCTLHLCGLLLLSLFIMPEVSFAGAGIHSTRAAGMGAAFIAVGDDPSALTFNPAGITQFNNTQFYGGVTAVVASTRYKSPTGESSETRPQVFFPPHFYVCSDFGSKDFRVGLGLSSPFGIGGRQWSEQGLTRYLSTESLISTVTLNPTVACRLLPNLSVAAGVDYMRAWTDQTAMVDQSLVNASDGKMELSGHGDGWGWNVGILFTPSHLWSLGVQYRSSITVDYEGKLVVGRIAPPLQSVFGGSTFRSHIRASNTFPDILGFGAAFRPSQKWTIAWMRKGMDGQALMR